MQFKAVKAALEHKSLLTIFPTGGVKSITFQVPALLTARATRGLTVVISPLQSLMKDQVDNLKKRGITDAVTINGLLDPIERSKAFERVEDGSAKLLYISPEALRSRFIERLLTGRTIERFVIDEVHCFSVWGQWKERIIVAFLRTKEEIGRVPSRMEFFESLETDFYKSKKANRKANPFVDYTGFLEGLVAQGYLKIEEVYQLSEDERRFVHFIETTSMVQLY